MRELQSVLHKTSAASRNDTSHHLTLAAHTANTLADDDQSPLFVLFIISHLVSEAHIWTTWQARTSTKETTLCSLHFNRSGVEKVSPYHLGTPWFKSWITRKSPKILGWRQWPVALLSGVTEMCCVKAGDTGHRALSKVNEGQQGKILQELWTCTKFTTTCFRSQ